MPYSFWRDYLKVFEQIRVVARIHPVTHISADLKRASGPGLEFVPIPYYVGPLGFLSRLPGIVGTLRQVTAERTAVLLRVPSILGSIAVLLLRASGRPYAVQVVGDPFDVFAPGAVRHPLRPVFRGVFTLLLKWQCRGASAASYVTQAALQRRYPTRAGFTNHFSNVELPTHALVPQAKTDWADLGTPARPAQLILVGSLSQLYKGPDVLLRSVALMKAAGLHIRLTIIGDGRHRHELEDLAQQLDLAHDVDFVGQLPPGDAIRSRLDDADLFVLPSRTEGLPRAMIEAMARSLPCVGSAVGGIPELLPSEALVPPGEPAALADRLGSALRDPHWLQAMSSRNLEVARSFSDDVLSQRRSAFLQAIRDFSGHAVQSRETGRFME
ncbi:glycosyltransferase [Deinococcus cavernae]|uniref:Glycosyltransferase n=2 Tax=Deinococcus cavernae TaxID=2320857 RepID=A0A418VCC3_9DEIO|nr:glycosyltransferase [Deinococcus cavernae]